ncbi:MAG: hypothetical protein J6X56_02860, partial [Ruminococcus sp.]|nr:hypothetical protein [Ruminococcus sp.]
MGFQREYTPFGEVQRQSLWLGLGQSPKKTKRFAKGEFPNSPADCLERGNALQVKAFPEVHIN